MLQIVVWGIAIMLVVKGLDVAHQQSIAHKSGNGSFVPAVLACIVAFLGAAFLVVTADQQVKNTPAAPQMPSFGNP